MSKLISAQFKELSLGAIKNTTDLTLFVLAFGVGLMGSGRSTRGVHKAVQFAEGITVDNIRRSLDQLKSKGWIKRDLTVTLEGQKRLNTFVPIPRKYPRRWSGIWYLISFDIPEKIAWKRNNLRTTLHRMGFGKLHESLWISPYNFLGDVQNYCKSEGITTYVLPAISKEVGTRASRELADRVWGLEALNTDYAAWIRMFNEEQNDPKTQFKLIFNYSAILRRDPFVPKPILPSPWHGEIAHKSFRKLAPLEIFDVS